MIKKDMKFKNLLGNIKKFEIIKGLNVAYNNVPIKLRIDPYHQIHSIGWIKAIFYFLTISFTLNSVFAVLYWLGPVPLQNSKGSWWECFLYGIQKFSDIGYGNLIPVDLYTQVIAVVHSFCGLACFAIITGYFFSKFSLIRSRILFTEKATITSFQDQPALVFRIVNMRKSNVGELEVTLSLFLNINGPGGRPLKEGFDLKVVRSEFPILALCVNIIHPIDEQSPLLKYLGDNSFNGPVEILATVNGIDSTFGQFVQNAKIYRQNDIVFGKNFDNVLQKLDDESYVIDFDKFNQLM